MRRVLSADVHRLVAAFAPLSDRDRAMHADFATLFADEHGPVSRDSGPHHATASSVVFDVTLTHTLLVFHGKGRFWVQPGGHMEDGDESVTDAALRELREETGIDAAVPAAPPVYDLDHHPLSARFGRCASHYDIGIAMIADPALTLTVSEESDAVRWWPVDALPDAVPEQLVPRLAGMRERLRRRG